MISVMIDSALRSLILAFVVWPGLQALCLRSVVAQNAPMPAIAIDRPAFARLQNELGASRQVFGYRNMIVGDSYVIVRGHTGESVTTSGDTRAIDIDKARKLAHGDFLWFKHGDKQYYIDDPTVLAQIEAMYKPIEELGKQQDELGRKQQELGKQQEALRQQQEQTSVPVRDIQKEIGAEERELGAQEGQLGAQEGKLGAEEGRLGVEQRSLEREADRKVRSIIDESLTNGKARPIN